MGKFGLLIDIKEQLYNLEETAISLRVLIVIFGVLRRNDDLAGAVGGGLGLLYMFLQIHIHIVGWSP
jgi:hypothetical protein